MKRREVRKGWKEERSEDKVKVEGSCDRKKKQDKKKEGEKERGRVGVAEVIEIV